MSATKLTVVFRPLIWTSSWRKYKD